MIFTNSFFRLVSSFNFPVFLFGEEIYFAELIRNVGLRVLYTPDLIIYDTDHVSTGKMRRSEYYRYNYEALTILMKMFKYE